nr:retrovirus-related Pol polyprotein from transposon TNT 1-94 [Tanacetum cinerariifolium]
MKTPMVPPNNLGPDLNGKAVNMTQYRDSDYVGCNMDRKSTSGACQFLGGKLMCWSAKKQQYMAICSAEAKYVAAAECCASILWMKSQLTDYDIIYEKIILDFISKCCLKEAFTKVPNQYVEYLAELWYTAKTLEGSKIWVSTPTKVRPWFSLIRYNGEIGAIGTLKKSRLSPRSLLLKYMMPKYDHEVLTINPTQVFSVYNWALKPNQPNGPPFTDHMKAICNIDMHVESQALKTSSKTEMKVPQGKKPRFRSGLKRKQSLKHTSKSKTEASKSKTSQLDKETQSSSTKDKSPSHPSASTPVNGKMHKEAHQAASGLTSLGATSEKGAHPSLVVGMDEGTQNYSLDHIFTGTNSSVFVDKTKSARDGLKTTHADLCTNKESRSDEISKKIKQEDLSNLMQDTRSAFLTPDSLQDESIIISDESEEEESKRYGDTHTTPYDGLKDTSIPHLSSPKSVQIQELMSQVTYFNLKKTSWSNKKQRLKQKLLSLKLGPHIHISTNLLNFWFSTIMENASTKPINKCIPSAGHASASPTEGKKNTHQATKDADNANLKQQPTTITPPTTSSFKSPLFPKRKGKEVMSSKDAKDED